MKRKTKIFTVLLFFTCFLFYFFCILKGVSWRLGTVSGTPATALHIALPGFTESVKAESIIHFSSITSEHTGMFSEHVVTYKNGKRVLYRPEIRSKHFTMRHWYRISKWNKHKKQE